MRTKYFNFIKTRLKENFSTSLNSVVWDSFVRFELDISSDGKLKVQCTLCKQDYIMAPTFGTSNLKPPLSVFFEQGKRDSKQPIDQKSLLRENIIGRM